MSLAVLPLPRVGRSNSSYTFKVEVYQSDFRAERESREALADEREKLRDEIRQLQTKNMQLFDELAALHRTNLTRGSLEGTSRASVSPDKTQNPEPNVIDENLFYCPKCNRSFTQLGPLEHHVNQCLDED